MAEVYLGQDRRGFEDDSPSGCVTGLCLWYRSIGLWAQIVPETAFVH